MRFVKIKFILIIFYGVFVSASLFAQRQMEYLNRGTIALQSAQQMLHTGFYLDNQIKKYPNPNTIIINKWEN